MRIGDREGDATARVVEADTPEDALARRLVLAKYCAGEVLRDTDGLAGWGATALPVAFDLGPWVLPQV